MSGDWSVAQQAFRDEVLAFCTAELSPKTRRKVLAGLAKRIDKELTASSVHTPDDVEAFLKSL